MAGYINTDTELLEKLYDKLYHYYNSTKHLKAISDSELYEFEQLLETTDLELKEDEYIMMKLEYKRCKENYIEALDRMLNLEIMNDEGRRNIATLISILHTYLNLK